MFELRPYSRRADVSAYNPFKEADEFEKAFFGNALSFPFSHPLDGFFGRNALAEFKTDITDEGDHYLLEADLPGFDKNDIKLDVNGDILTVKAERKSEKKTEKKDKYICSERSYGCYTREFDISAINSQDISAKYDNGVLTLKLPKKENILPESRKIEIE